MPLTPEQARELMQQLGETVDRAIPADMRRHAAGEGAKALAAEYGISTRNLHSIASRSSWRHVA